MFSMFYSKIYAFINYGGLEAQYEKHLLYL